MGSGLVLTPFARRVSDMCGWWFSVRNESPGHHRQVLDGYYHDTHHRNGYARAVWIGTTRVERSVEVFRNNGEECDGPGYCLCGKWQVLLYEFVLAGVSAMQVTSAEM